MLRRGASASCRRGCRGAHRSRRPGRSAARQRSHGALIPLSHADRVLLTVPTQVGYPALAALVLGESAGLPLPGESALLAAAGLAAAGQLALPLVIAVAAGTAILGDGAGYALGRGAAAPSSYATAGWPTIAATRSSGPTGSSPATAPPPSSSRAGSPACGWSPR